MPSGGARTRSGPPRQRDAIRHGRGGDSGWIPLPSSGREGDTPTWPLGRATKFEREQWEREWRRPQAIMWERLGWEIQVALYVRTLRAAAAPNAAAATTTNLLRQMDGLGISQDGLARNRWYVVEDAQAAARPVKRAPTTSAKDRIRVIQGGADERAS